MSEQDIADLIINIKRTDEWGWVLRRHADARAEILSLRAQLAEEQTARKEGWAKALALRILVKQMSERDHENIMASVSLGKWMAAALDDPSVCENMKEDIRRWFSAGEPVAAANLQVQIDDLHTLLAEARDKALEEVIAEIEKHDFTHTLLPTIIRALKGNKP